MKHEGKKTTATRSSLWLWLCVTILWLAVGCAATSTQTLPSPPQPVIQAPVPAVYGWWSVRFRMDRPTGETRWEKDLLLAHQVVAPLIRTHDGDIALWRFHRRAAKDDTGHQFSFLFYTTAAVADSINQVVMDDPLVKRMIADGVIQEVITDSVDHNDRPNVGDTSDPNWSPVVRNTWPHYIMGVSRMWLGMIDQVFQERGISDEATLGQLLVHYEHVNDEITHIWQQEGYHAFLHHLNAIYGYEALVYWEKRLKSF